MKLFLYALAFLAFVGATTTLVLSRSRVVAEVPVPEPVISPPRYLRTAGGHAIVFSKTAHSFPTADGIHGIGPGTPLTLLGEMAGNVRVEVTGFGEIQLPAESVEWDANVGEALKHADRETAKARQDLISAELVERAARERDQLKRVAAATASRSALAVAGPDAQLETESSPEKFILVNRPHRFDTEAVSPRTCAITHHNGDYHRSVTGELYRCPSGVEK